MTRWTLYALSIPTLFWLSSIDATLAASIGLKCQKGNLNISVAGGSRNVPVAVEIGEQASIASGR
jgi:hypothetical protein